MIHPRLTDWILTCSVPAADREMAVGDLAEEYAIRRRDSRIDALRWYWSQVLRSIPWFLWMPVRRSGLFATLVVALGACVIQAAIEVSAAAALRRLPQAPTTLPIGLSVVLVSLFVVSYLAARARAGAGTVLTLIAIVAVFAQSVAMGAGGVSLTHLAAVIAAPSAAFAGAAVATVRHVRL